MKPIRMAAVVLTLLLAADLLLWRATMRKTIYRFRNVAFVGAFFALFPLLPVLILSSDRSLAELLRAYPWDFSRQAMLVVTVLGTAMFASNLALMRREGMRPTNMVGTFLGAIYALSTLALYELARVIERLAQSAAVPAVRFLAEAIPLWLCLLLDYAEVLALGIIVMGWIAARGKPKYDKDFIIIPGCSISKNGGLLPLLRGRTNRAVRYAWEQEIATGRRVRFVPSGGQGADEIMSEGSAMALYLLSHAAEEDEVFPEKRSASTYENFLFSRELIRSLDPDAKVAFATTNYHVLRCGMLAHRLGMEAEGIAASTKWYFWPNGFARELVAIFAMNRRAHLLASAALALLAAVLCGI